MRVFVYSVPQLCKHWAEPQCGLRLHEITYLCTVPVWDYFQGPQLISVAFQSSWEFHIPHPNSFMCCFLWTVFHWYINSRIQSRSHITSWYHSKYSVSALGHEAIFSCAVPSCTKTLLVVQYCISSQIEANGIALQWLHICFNFKVNFLERDTYVH